MRIALISDIHGNGVALDAVLDDLDGRGADRLACLGDAIQGGPQPAEVVARLRELGCPVVMGNADAWLLSGQDSGAEGPLPGWFEEIRRWTLEQLSTADRAFIAGFAPTIEVTLGNGHRLLGFHGSPASFDDVIVPATPDAEVQELLGRHLDSVLAGGHTHQQQLRRIARTFYVNPGSVGRAYDREPGPDRAFQAGPVADYALLAVDGDRVGVELRRVPFDAGALAAAYRASGMPHTDQALARHRAHG